MGNVLREWNLDERHALIANAFGALPQGGVLLAYDAVMEHAVREGAASSEESGLDYAGADCIGWMRDAGFRTAQAANLAGPYVMVVGVK